MAKGAGVKDMKAVTKVDATRMALMFVVGKSLIDAIYEDGMGVNSPNPTPVRDMLEVYDKDRSRETNSKALIALAKGFAGYVPVVSSATYGGGFGGAGYQALADVMGAKSGSRLMEAASKLTLLPGVSTYKTAKKAYARGEENPFYYLVQKKDAREARKR